MVKIYEKENMRLLARVKELEDERPSVMCQLSMMPDDLTGRPSPKIEDLATARALLERWVPTESFTNEEKLAVIHDTIAFLAPQGEGRHAASCPRLAVWDGGEEARCNCGFDAQGEGE